VVESCLYVSLVSADSFRRYTIIAENAIGIGRQRTVLTQRTCSVSFTEQYYFLILFCSLAVLDPRVTIRYDTRCYFNVRSKADISKYGLATPWTYFLHLSLSSVILIDSSTESPVRVLMLFIQAVRGLPRLYAPGIVPCIISFSRQLLRFLMV